MSSWTITRVMAGGKAPLGPHGEQSAIRKRLIDGPVPVTREGLDGDEHAYHGHGGPDKAILQYAVEHYESYRERFPDFSAEPESDRGGFGENLSAPGMSEETVCLGDRYRIGTVVAEVSAFRQPCYKLGYTSTIRDIPRIMQEDGTTGWYYRVLEPGTVAAGEEIVLLDRPYPRWSVARLIRGFYGTPLDRGFIDDALAIPVLGGEIRDVLERRLASGRTEDWYARLYGRTG